MRRLNGQLCWRICVSPVIAYVYRRSMYRRSMYRAAFNSRRGNRCVFGDRDIKLPQTLLVAVSLSGAFFLERISLTLQRQLSVSVSSISSDSSSSANRPRMNEAATMAATRSSQNLTLLLTHFYNFQVSNKIIVCVLHIISPNCSFKIWALLVICIMIISVFIHSDYWLHFHLFSDKIVMRVVHIFGYRTYSAYNDSYIHCDNTPCAYTVLHSFLNICWM